LWLSAPPDFNDPFDTSACIVSQGTDADMSAMLVRRGTGVTKLTEAQKEQRRRELLADTPQFEVAVQAAFRTNLDQLGVACFTPLPRNLLMWSHYAASHKGLVLQFEPTRHLDLFTYPVKVEYERTYPVVNWIGDHVLSMRLVMLRKHPAWEYEQEYRMVHPGGARSYLPFAPGGLTGVILGCKATSEVVDCVQGLIEERQRAGHPPVRLFQAQQHTRDYALIFRRVG
jgi:hypothetical protein